MSSEYTFNESPAAFPIVERPPQANIIEAENWRISVLTEGLLRLEYSATGHFEDHASLMATNRNLGATQFTVSRSIHNELVVETSRLRLTYNEQPFSPEGLNIVVKGVPFSQFNTWHYGDTSTANLKGTARTLDGANGEIELSEGVASRDGWAVIDDSRTNLLVHHDDNPFGYWIEPRSVEETDIYFFGYGLDYRQAVQAFQRLSGKPPVVPRYALGNWWSRYHRYSESEYLELMKRFEQQRVPLSVSVIDMDWHVTDIDPKYGSGWTGYTWNRELFPDPARFLHQLKQKYLKPSLNLHPRDGVRAFEDGYAQLAKDMGIDPASGIPVEFDPTDPNFMYSYFRDILQPMEKDGVKFWWLDWQQGSVTRQKGLDPLWSLNHLHYLESAGADKKSWPIIFSRFAGPGSQRYPVGFSGDTVVSWDSLKFQPYFTVAASNIGYGWWSHDIGGHMRGVRDNDLEARWYQFGTFSPIMRLHSVSSQFNTKEPWNFPEPYCHAMKESLRLRNRLVPYLYSMDWRAAVQGIPLVEPLYWREPLVDAAYRVANEYYFGSELLVAPITQPLDPVVQRSRTVVHLPQGEWYDFFTGRRYNASGPDGRTLPVWRDIEHIPVFARSGGIVPLQDEMARCDENPGNVTLLLFPDSQRGTSTFDLIEDDGTFPEYCAAYAAGDTASEASSDTSAQERAAGDTCERDLSHRAVTHIKVDWEKREVHISAPEGNTACIPAHRTYTFIIRGVELDEEQLSIINASSCPVNCSYQPETLSLTLDAANRQEGTSAQELTLKLPVQPASNPVLDDVADVLRNVQMSFDQKDAAYRALAEEGYRATAFLQTLPDMSENTKEAISEIYLRD